MSIITDKQYIELKVMRLSMPHFNSNLYAIGEQQDYCYDQMKYDLEANCNINSDLEYPSSLGLRMKLPQTFGTIYLGETFKAYVTIHNPMSDQSVYNVSLMIYVQTTTQKLCIFATENNSGIPNEIGAKTNFDSIVSHEVKELGPHVLICEVQYTLKPDVVSSNSGKDDSNVLQLKKFFKFQVNKPLDVKTKFYNSDNGQVYLETQVQNLTSNPMVLEQMSLLPHPNYIVKDFNYHSKDETQLIFNDINCLLPNDVRQYLFGLYIKQKPILSKEALLITEVGKLQIGWRGPYGEKGALQTSPLHRLPTVVPDIFCQIEQIPDQAGVEETFEVICRFTNFTERSMDLDLELIDDFNEPQNMYWIGILRKHVGKLEPNCFNVLTFTLYATRPGFKSISGIRLIDTFLNRTYDYDNIGQVYVMTNS